MAARNLQMSSLQNYGYVLDYYGCNEDAWTPERLEADGFYPRGTKVRFINENGYDEPRQWALEKLGTEKSYTVKWCHIGGWSSSYEFEEVDGSFNHVMFEKVSDEVF
jgi:hypothetical protein